ncbi:MAG: hypothetical protein ACE5GM_08760 [bacterium]
MEENGVDCQECRQLLDTYSSMIEGIVHKLNNILTGISTNASLIGMLSARSGGEVGPRICGLSEKMESAVYDIDNLLTKMVDFNYSVGNAPNVFNPVSLIEDSLDIIKVLLRKRISLRTRLLKESLEIKTSTGTFINLLYCLAIYSNRLLNGEGEVVIGCQLVAEPSENNLPPGKYLEVEFLLVGSTSSSSRKQAREQNSFFQRNTEEILDFVMAKTSSFGGILSVTAPYKKTQAVKLFWPVITD